MTFWSRPIGGRLYVHVCAWQAARAKLLVWFS